MTDVIRVHDVSKQFALRKDKSLKERLVNARRSKEHAEEFWALRDIDLTFSAGSTTGLIGHNGSGKSTLLKVIGGILTPTSGTCAVSKVGPGMYSSARYGRRPTRPR